MNCKECIAYIEGKECKQHINDEEGNCVFFELYNEKDQDERYNKLPIVFQKRLTRFRTNNPNFKRQFEHYELFCCEEAIKIADFCKNNGYTIQQFYDDRKLQKGVIFEGHSINTFVISCKLAHHYITNMDYIILEHGALTSLVGCENYGCDNPPKQTTIELLSPEGKIKMQQHLKKERI